MKQIDKDNAIFNSEDFQKDKYKFNLILKNLPSPDLELYSDEENYIICRGNKAWPTWVWTKDGFDKNKMAEIEEAITTYLTEADRDKFTCKKELYDLLVARGFDVLNPEDYFEMGFLICHTPIKPKECDGEFDVSREDDRATLVQYWFDDSQEMNGVDPIMWEQAEADVDEFLKSGRFYVWRNSTGKIVCMVGYNVTGGQAKLAHVYTPVEERGKGYAANIIYCLTNKLLSDGLVPLLYTDYNYAPSNKAYINAGYEDTGILINFSCSKAKRKEM